MITTESKNINYKSDFDFILKLQRLNTEGNYEDVGFPDYSFTVLLYTNSYRKYIVKYNKEKDEYINCANTNNQIQIIVNNHKLSKGKLKADIYLELPNADYNDGYKLLVCSIDTGIELVSGCSDIKLNDITLIAPYIKGDKGEPLTWEDMSEDNKNELYTSILDNVKDIILTSSMEGITDNHYDEITL